MPGASCAGAISAWPKIDRVFMGSNINDKGQVGVGAMRTDVASDPSSKLDLQTCSFAINDAHAECLQRSRAYPEQRRDLSNLIPPRFYLHFSIKHEKEQSSRLSAEQQPCATKRGKSIFIQP